MKTVLVTCPICGKDMKLNKLLDEWFEITREAKLPSELFYSLRCDNCQDETIELELHPTVILQENYSPLGERDIVVKD